ncbi:hypothetical protein Tco_0630951, partial [Tanacetum coccineum]
LRHLRKDDGEIWAIIQNIDQQTSCVDDIGIYGGEMSCPIFWIHVGERILEGPEMIEVTNEKVAVAREKLKEAQTRQKSYDDRHRRALEFQPGARERVFSNGLEEGLSKTLAGEEIPIDGVPEVNMTPSKSIVAHLVHTTLEYP